MRETTRITRVKIPDTTKQQALMETGYRCSVPRCSAEWPGLHFHHLDEEASGHDSANLLVLCPAHFEMVSAGDISTADCTKLKAALVAFVKHDPDEVEPIRNRLLYSLAGELYVDLGILDDDKYRSLDDKDAPPIVYPRLLRTVLDQALASGAFIHAHDRDLFDMLHKWSEILDEFNRRLDITELRSLSVIPATARAKAAVIDHRGIEIARGQCRGLAVYLLEEYGSEAGLDFATLFADTGLYQKQG